jgi:hypothetical protein
VFVKLNLKSLSMTNTLAYYENSKFTDKKGFITLGPGVNVYKLFLLQGELGKTSYSVSLWQLFKASLIFVD